MEANAADWNLSDKWAPAEDISIMDARIKEMFEKDMTYIQISKELGNHGPKYVANRLLAMRNRGEVGMKPTNVNRRDRNKVV